MQLPERDLWDDHHGLPGYTDAHLDLRPLRPATPRDRIARVAEWAWPMFWAYAKDFLPVARLWREDLTPFTVSDWHRETVRELKLPVYPLKNARHHWAVRMLGAGVPIHVVQWQLGHSTAKLTLDTYGRWMSGSEDRARAEAQVTQFEPLTSNPTSTTGDAERAVK